MLIYFSFLLILCICEKPTYIKSIFGAPGTDEIENEYIDGVEILETGLNHPNTVSIYNKGFSSKPIEPSDYPYPGHDLTGSCMGAYARRIQQHNKKIFIFKYNTGRII